MTISYPITLPTSPAPASVKLYGHAIVAVGVSPFTAQQQVYQHQGQFWRAQITLPPMRREDAEPWIAAMLSLNGRRGTFYLGDASATTPRGTATGTPLVNGASQTGQTLVTDGWTSGVTGILKAGDYMQIGDRLYKVLADANSDGTGNATFDIWPRLRESPADNAAITVTNTKGLFRRADNAAEWDIAPGKIFSMSFEAVEAI